MNVKLNNFSENSETKEIALVKIILECSNELRNVQQSKIIGMLPIFETIKTFSVSMKKLFETVSGISYLNESKVETMPIPKIGDFRNNSYAYFKNVSNTIGEYSEIENTSMLSLNEAVISLNNTGYDFLSFKKELDDCIAELEKVNDFEKLASLPFEIQKIKILARKPLYVLGFDVVNSPLIRNEIFNTFGLDVNNAFAVIWDKTNRQLLYPFKGKLISYDVATNRLGDFNDINKDVMVDTFTGEKLMVKSVDRLELGNYQYIIEEENNRNLAVIWTNLSLLEIKFTDNLYGDVSRKEWLDKNKGYSDKNSLVKNTVNYEIEENFKPVGKSLAK